MSESKLSNGWHKFRFDEMAIMVNDRVDDPSQANVDYYVGLEHLDSDSLKIRRWGSPTDVKATKLRFGVGDIIFGRRRVYQRKLAVADFDGICSAHAMVLRANSAVVLPQLLPFFMQTNHFMERAKEISVGSLSPTINWKTLAKEEFRLPPLQEQRRVAEVLDAVEVTFNSHMRIADSAATLYESALESFFHSNRNPLVSDWRGDWHVSSLKDLADVRFSNADKKSVPGEHAIGLCSYMDVYCNDQITETMSFMEATATAKEIERFAIRKGDIIITKDSETPDDIGIPAIVVADVPNVICGYHLAIIRPHTDLLDARFLFHYLKCSLVRSHFCRRANGVTRYGLPSDAVLNLAVNAPARTQQVLIADRLDQCRESAAHARSQAALYADFKKMMLQRLLVDAAHKRSEE